MPETALAEHKPFNPKPPLYGTPEALETAITDYFEYCSVQHKVPTVAGMAYHLGFESRQSMYDYENRDTAGGAYLIKKARTYMESDLAQRAILGKGSIPGVIFTLKAMHGWQETSVVEHHHDVTLSIDQLTQQARSLLAQASPEQLRVLGVDKTDDVIDIPALPVPDRAKVDR